MAAAVISRTRPTDVRGAVMGNKRVRFFDITADTGDYAADGFTLTAAQLGMARHVDICIVGSVATTGANGATASPIGVEYESSGTVVRFHLYETGTAADTPLNEKTAEAYAANFTFRVMVVGN
jgi:hypothetical protein